MLILTKYKTTNHVIYQVACISSEKENLGISDNTSIDFSSFLHSHITAGCTVTDMYLTHHTPIFAFKELTDIVMSECFDLNIGPNFCLHDTQCINMMELAGHTYILLQHVENIYKNLLWYKCTLRKHSYYMLQDYLIMSANLYQ